MVNVFTVRGKKLNRFSLEFVERKLEKQFYADYISNSLLQNRLSLLLGIIVYTAFSILDYYLIPELFVRFLYTRLFIVIPLGLISFALTFIKNQKIGNYSIVLSVFVAGIVLDYFSMTTGYLHLSPYYFGIVLYFIFIFSLIRMVFVQSLLVALVVFAFFEFSLFTYGTLEFSEQIIANLFVVSGLLITVCAGYMGELVFRKNFLIRTELEFANKSITKSRASLEDEVQKRTMDLVKVNNQLRKSKLRAEGSENLKTNFIANVSHEIRTPLTRIIGFSELLTKAELTLDKKVKYSGILQENSDQLLRVITDMIELSKLQTNNIIIEKNLFYLDRFLKSFDSLFTELAAKYSKNHINFSIDNFIADDKFQINSDKNELRRVITYLLDNAIKFTNKGFVKLSCNTCSDDHLIFCVTDTGIGIDKENQEFVFDHFRQVDDGSTRSYGGVGVGLSISKEIIRNLKGKIWMESEKKKGTSFYFKIPFN